MILFDHAGLTVTRYLPDYGHVLLTDAGSFRLTPQQWDALCEFITADCGPECESPRRAPLPDNWRWSA